MNTLQEDIDSRNIDFAPWLAVPSDRIVRIEHPGIVRNIEKGIASLGGKKELAAVRLSHPLRDINQYAEIHPSVSTFHRP